MADCLCCGKPVGLSKKTGKPRKLHGDRKDRESCAYQYQRERDRVRGRLRVSVTKAKAKTNADLVKQGYMPIENFNDSFGV